MMLRRKGSRQLKVHLRATSRTHCSFILAGNLGRVSFNPSCDLAVEDYCCSRHKTLSIDLTLATLTGV